MKCPECTVNQKFKDGMICQICDYHFLLNPKEQPRMGDNHFLSLVAAASAQDSLYFTFEQLYGHYSQFNEAARKKALLVPLAILAVVCLISWPLIPFVTAPLALASLALSVFLLTRKTAGSQHVLREVLSRWETARGPLAKLIREPRLGKPPDKEPEADLYDYGVEKVLIVQRPLLVDLLVLNGWHAQEKALVMSEDGYPSFLASQAQRLLAQDPKLPIFLLHDPTPQGVGMLTRLTYGNLFPIEDHPVTDLGLSLDNLSKVPFLKLHDEHKGHGVALDLLPYGMLAAALGNACQGEMAFVDLLGPSKAEVVEPN